MQLKEDKTRHGDNAANINHDTISHNIGLSQKTNTGEKRMPWPRRDSTRQPLNNTKKNTQTMKATTRTSDKRGKARTEHQLRS